MRTCFKTVYVNVIVFIKASTSLNSDWTLGTVDSRGPFYPSLAKQLSLVAPSSEAAKCCSEAQRVLVKQTKNEVSFNPSLAVATLYYH